MGEFTTESAIYASSATSAYREILRNVLTWGEEYSPRGKKIKELRPVMFRIDGPSRWVGQPTRKLSNRLGILEGLQLISGTTLPQALVSIAPSYTKFVNPANGELDGAYGPRVVQQVPYIVRLLGQDPDSRQAVITIYNTDDHHTSLDIPCTLSLQFFLRDNPLARYPNGFEFDKFCPLHGRHGPGAGICICNRWWSCGSCGEISWGTHCHMCGGKGPESIYAEEFDSLPNPHFVEEGGPPPKKALELHVDMRSNDAWLGVPYDVIQFSMLQTAMAAELDAAVGSYTHMSHSMHLYKKDWVRAEALIEDRGDTPLDMPDLGKLPYRSSVLEATATYVQWWQGRAAKEAKDTETGETESSLLKAISEARGPGGADTRHLSPFFTWCLTEMTKEDETDGK